MRYTSDHKQETRRRIITRAARRFRDEGYAPASVADIMSDAGLTHGGFYAHFGSKEELFAEAIANAADEGLTAGTAVGGRRGRARLGALVSQYLNQQHWSDRAGGCPLAALGGEVARAGDLPRASYGASAASLQTRSLPAWTAPSSGARRRPKPSCRCAWEHWCSLAPAWIAVRQEPCLTRAAARRHASANRDLGWSARDRPSAPAFLPLGQVVSPTVATQRLCW